MNKTIKSLATEIQTSVDRLIQQFADAGITKSANDSVTIQEKKTLLAHLNRSRNASVSNKLTLQRKTRSVLNILSSSGKSKSIQIEIRKSHTFIKHNLQNTKQTTENEQTQQQNEEKELIAYKVEKSTKYQEKLKTEYKTVEKIKCTTAEKNKIANQQTHDLSVVNMQTEQDLYKNKDAQPEYKTEKSIHCLLDEYRWKDTADLVESAHYDDISTSPHSKLIKDEKSREVKNNREAKSSHGRRDRNAKISRHTKRSKKHFELKDNHKEDYTALKNNKNIIKRKNSTLQQIFQKPTQTINRSVIIGETITVGELANKMAIKSSQIIKIMMTLGVMATINQVIDQETAQLIAEEMGHKVIFRRENELEETIMIDRDMGLIPETRAPVVTIMGHVDHGKTSLLDYIRSTKVALSEAGGITQYIGAYHVKTKSGAITFLDTPGHAAFTGMRARGTQVTDIVVLVVAADDGVMPQTIEAIQHAKAAQVPIVVAVNKIDKPDADLNRVKNELAKNGLILEEWGGDCQCVLISAKTGTGIDELLNAISLQAAILELKAIRKGMANGVVIESFLDKGRGPVATVLVCEGTLKKGDIILCGFHYGRIRAMRNELGHEIIKAGPSIPVEIIGLSGIPTAGDKITVVRDEKRAREVALHRQGKFREIKFSSQHKSKLDALFTNNNENKTQEVNIVLKADLQGSVEAISDYLLKLSTNEIKVKLIGSGVGGITETDAILAAASNAILIGFNVRADTSARRIIAAENLDLRYYSVIYNLINEIKTLMGGILVPKLKHQIIGLAEVRDVFKSPRFGLIAGCMVTNGIIKRHNPIHILRNNIVIYKGELESLRRFKDDVYEVRNGMECGIGVKNYNDIHVGDMIEVFDVIEHNDI